ncbi:MAG: hypothetical protein ACYTFY_11755 [Planctomycetota bacterium]|jgi:hypothetical protein
MPQGTRRQSQNSVLMRKIIEQLREYDIDEVRHLCEKFMTKERRTSRRSSRRKRK